MSDDIYIDWRETPFKIGDHVKCDDDQVGLVTKISDPDGDVDDDTGRDILIPPKLFVKFDDSDVEEQFTGYNATPAPDWYDEEPQFTWQFDDVEVVKDEDTAPWRSATGDRP